MRAERKFIEHKLVMKNEEVLKEQNSTKINTHIMLYVMRTSYYLTGKSLKNTEVKHHFQSIWLFIMLSEI